MTDSPNATPYLPPAQSAPEDYVFSPPGPSDKRSPCPALNTLANHGYLPHDGLDIGFFELIRALRHVYNLSLFLALFLTIVGFVVSGTFTFSARSELSDSSSWSERIQKHVPLPRWRLNLSSLSERGPKKIAHDAGLVHQDGVPSHAPDKKLLDRLLAYTSACSVCRGGCRLRGLSLADIAHFHASREKQLSKPLNDFHEKVALGECGLAWIVMSQRCVRSPPGGGKDERKDLITERALEVWFGREQLPSDWWVEGGSRPKRSVGLLEAKRRAADVARLSAK